MPTPDTTQRTLVALTAYTLERERGKKPQTLPLRCETWADVVAEIEKQTNRQLMQIFDCGQPIYDRDNNLINGQSLDQKLDPFLFTGQTYLMVEMCSNSPNQQNLY